MIEINTRMGMKMGFDLSKMTLDELNTLEKDVQKAKVAVEKKRVVQARKALEETAKQHGVSLEEIFGAKSEIKGASKSAPKYANPDNPEQTWTGRGRQPTWYREAVGAGTDPSALEI
ncbi:H-NS family nucleoid-associated regulatory protein [Dinoroseobacter sp. S124A]|uniref:H-NS histone family protein n=1 Tax=Dinoroseobacter sp. S124A TaxID=3415128 RepID=UPI003C7EA504